MNLTTEVDLAAEWGVDLAKFAELRRQNRWPHVRLGRFDVRYTEDQVAAILEIQTQRSGSRGKTSPAKGLPGQTTRSAKKSA